MIQNLNFISLTIRNEAWNGSESCHWRASPAWWKSVSNYSSLKRVPSPSSESDSESSSWCWALIYFKVKMMWAGCGWLQHQSRLQSIWEVTQILREPALAARCLAACGNWGRNFSSSSRSRSNNNNNNSSINHCQGSQLKGPSVGFSHVRYVNGIRKVFKQEPSWMYIYLNTHILLRMCVWFW